MLEHRPGARSAPPGRCTSEGPTYFFLPFFLSFFLLFLSFFLLTARSLSAGSLQPEGRSIAPPGPRGTTLPARARFAPFDNRRTADVRGASRRGVYLILNLSAVLNAPAPDVLTPRTFHVKYTWRGSALLARHESAVAPVFLSSSLLPL